uniref:Uncharacterized protein n=1 Tax=Laticauda laticaudata TaxID=8630 RepID=A0A8C5WS99_LATLA
MKTGICDVPTSLSPLLKHLQTIINHFLECINKVGKLWVFFGTLHALLVTQMGPFPSHRTANPLRLKSNPNKMPPLPQQSNKFFMSERFTPNVATLRPHL